MSGVLLGFATIAVVIAVGWLLAHWRVLDVTAQVALSRLAFNAASPALLLTVMQRTPLDRVISGNMLTAAVAFAVTAGLYLAFSRFVAPGASTGERLIGTLCSGYANAGNLGLPIALYVLGDVAWAAPMLLLQLLLITPVFMSLFDRVVSGPGTSFGRLASRLVSNPITVGALTGLLLTIFDITLPPFLAAPVDLLGSMAVPSMLIAFGISLRLGPRPGAGSVRHVWFAVVLKLLLMPAVALGVGAAIGLRGHELFAVVVVAALPTAQNIFTYAVNYDRGATLARDVIFTTTVLSLPVILGIAAVFHAVGAV